MKWVMWFLAGMVLFSLRYGCIRSGDNQALEYGLAPGMGALEVQRVFKGHRILAEGRYDQGHNVQPCDIVYREEAKAFSWMSFDCGLAEDITVYFGEDGTVVAASYMRIR